MRTIPNFQGHKAKSVIAPGISRESNKLLTPQMHSLRNQMMRRVCSTSTLSARHASARVSRPALRAIASQVSTTEAEQSGSALVNRRNGPARICVLGGGFGGLYTAIRLESLMWPKGSKPEVTLIDRTDRFVFKPLLYELLNGGAQQWEVAPTFTQLLAPYPIKFMKGKVDSVQVAEGAVPGGTVTLSDGASVEYDYLVVALGSQADPRGVPGVKELALPFNNYDDAVKLAGRLEELSAAPGTARVTVVGAGYAGVELASVVAERLRGRGRVQVVAVGDDILDGAPSGQREAAKEALAALGVEIITGTKVRELKPRAAAEGSETAGLGSCVVLLEQSSAAEEDLLEKEVDLLLWTAGSAPATRLDRLPFPTSPSGALEVAPTLQLASHPNVFAVGDTSLITAADSTTGRLPHTAQVAFQQADYAAWNLWAALNGRPLLPFRYQHLGSMMSLGQLNAAVALPISLPPPLRQSLAEGPLGRLLQVAGVKLGDSDIAGDGVTVEGPLAQALRRAAYLYRQPTNEQRINVATSWVQQAVSTASDIVTKGGLPLPLPGASSSRQ